MLRERGHDARSFGDKSSERCFLDGRDSAFVLIFGGGANDQVPKGALADHDALGARARDGKQDARREPERRLVEDDELTFPRTDMKRARPRYGLDEIAVVSSAVDHNRRLDDAAARHVQRPRAVGKAAGADLCVAQYDAAI